MVTSTKRTCIDGQFQNLTISNHSSIINLQQIYQTFLRIDHVSQPRCNFKTDTEIKHQAFLLLIQARFCFSSLAEFQYQNWTQITLSSRSRPELCICPSQKANSSRGIILLTRTSPVSAATKEVWQLDSTTTPATTFTHLLGIKTTQHTIIIYTKTHYQITTC